MIAYRFTIEGQMTATSITEAYGALSDVLEEIAGSLASYPKQAELNKKIRITLAPLPSASGPERADGPGFSDPGPLRRVVGVGLIFLLGVVTIIVLWLIFASG